MAYNFPFFSRYDIFYFFLRAKGKPTRREQWLLICAIKLLRCRIERDVPSRPKIFWTLLFVRDRCVTYLPHVSSSIVNSNGSRAKYTGRCLSKRANKRTLQYGVGEENLNIMVRVIILSKWLPFFFFFLTVGTNENTKIKP